MEEKQVLLILLVLARIAAAIICARKARELNRSQAAWGGLAFIFPLIAIILIHCMKYKPTWRCIK